MRKRMRLLYVLVVAFVIVAVGLITISQLDGDLAFLESRAKEIQEESVKLKGLNGDLTRIINKQDDKDFIIDLARSQYDYMMPGEMRFEVVNPEVLGIQPTEAPPQEGETTP